jgi:hypothetical protein
MKINSQRNILIHSFLFGPLAAGFLSGMDYKNAGEKNWLMIMFLPSVIVLIVLAIYIYILPENFYVPSYLIPGLYSIAYWQIQLYLVQKHPEITERSGFFTGCLPAIGGFVGLVILTFVLMIPYLLTP